MRKIFTLVLFLYTGLTALAQRSVEAGIMLGASNYIGELTETPTQNFYFAGGLIGRYNLNDHFSLKGNVFYGTISGADSVAKSEFSRTRNLSFKSGLFEFAALIEWNLWSFDPLGGKGKKGFTPFAFAGLGVYKYNPKAWYEPDNKWIELQPIGTEGQGTTQFQDRKKYKLTQLSIPIGGGVKIRVARGWTLGFEYGMRKTFNDYIDDVSLTYVEPGVLLAAYGEESRSAQLADRSIGGEPKEYDPLTFNGPGRGNPDTKDWYTYGGITITYTIFGNRVKCYSF